MSDLSISKFSSLNFDHDWRASFQTHEDYIQEYSNFDELTIQYTVVSDIPLEIKLTNLCNNSSTVIVPDEIDNSEGRITYNIVLKRLQTGFYKLEFIQTNLLSRPSKATSFFKITEFSDLKDSLIFSYTNDINTFDTIFTTALEEQIIFRQRVKGGFIPSDYQFQVSNESFRDQRYSNYQLSAFPYKIKTLTVGDNLGVPRWVGEKINLIFSMTEVLINGVQHVRSESSIPEMTEVSDRNYPKYVYKIEVEESDNTSLINIVLGSTEWLLRNGYWQTGIWLNSGIWKNY